MRTLFAILLFAIAPFTAYAQLPQQDHTTERQEPDRESSPIAVAYRLFPTKNMWTFVKLNTRNGQMWQVHFNLEDIGQEVYLNLVPLVTIGNEANDRFTLYPTENIYTFILLDQFDGRVWQVQWSWEPENRLVVPIE